MKESVLIPLTHRLPQTHLLAPKGGRSKKISFSNANSMFVGQDRPFAKVKNEILVYVPRPYLTEMGQLIEANHSADNIKFRKRRTPHIKSPHEEQKPSLATKSKFSKTDSSIPCLSVAAFGFSEKQESLIELLRSRLLKSRFYSINELHKPKNPKKPLSDEALSSELKTKLHALLLNSDKEEFIRLCIDDRQVSRALQIFIESCEDQVFTAVLKPIEDSIPDLIYHPLGNYALQIAAKRSPRIMERIENYCLSRLLELLNDEFASRVMQTIAEISPVFRKKILDWAGLNLGLLMETLPAVFALTAAISSTQSPGEFACIRSEILSQSARNYIKNRYFKRILMSFLEKCDESDIDRACKIYSIDKQLLAYLNDKFGAFIVVAIIRRGHRRVIDLFLKYLNSNMLDLYGTKFFKFLFFRLIRDTGLSPAMLTSLATMHRDHVKAATDTRAACLFFCYLVVATLAPEHSNALIQIERVSNSYDQLRDLLLHLPSLVQLRHTSTLIN